MELKKERSKGFMALGGLAVLAAAALFGSDSLYQGLSMMGKPVIYTPGTYEASAKGHGGMVTAKVTVNEREIVEVSLSGPDETEGIGVVVIEQIGKVMVERQSTDVDAVAGATVTSMAVKEAAGNALKKARGLSVEEWKEAGTEASRISGDVESENQRETEPVIEKEADQELTADVVVIGAGGAGLAAAVSASQEGASVIIVEKMPEIGGNLLISGGAINAVEEGSETALANGDSIQKYYDQTMSGGDNQGEPELVRTLVEHAWEGIEWLKSLGMEFKDEVFTAAGGLWPRAYEPTEPMGTGFVKAYCRYLEEHSEIEILLNTQATEIRIGESGIADTVAAKGKTGNTITLHAKKGIVAATGGFAANTELRREYNEQWPDLGEEIKSTNQEGTTGDAIPMLKALGADFVQMENIQLLPFGDPETGGLTGNIGLDAEHCIFVNENGDRFTDEGGRRDDMTKALLEQPDHSMWIVMDSDCYPTGEEVNRFGESLSDLVSRGRVMKGDTLEELAVKMEVPAENLIAAAEEFNAHAEEKTMDDFGRTLYSTQIDDGPFYAVMRVPTVHSTMGGVKINTKAQVISTEGEVIPGLYAAGEVTGGIHGANRLGGNALTDTVVFGRIAGREAALNGEDAGSKDREEASTESGPGL